MKITESQFIKIVERAFVHGIVLSRFFPDPFGDGEGILTKEEQREKVNEVIEDCRHLTNHCT